MEDDQSVSSPTATGGAGTFFEQHVGAKFLALLLVRGIPPLLKECQVEGVHFQTEHLGWNTDDILVVGHAGGDRKRKLVAQVKRSFTVSSRDTACRNTFVDFWKDFRNEDKFDPDTDRLALITQRGTNVLLDNFGSLLNCARASTDGSDFERRLSVDGLLSKKARAQAKAVRTIIEEEFGEPSEEDFWRFMKVLHVVSFDLATETAQQEAQAKTLLAQTSDEPDPVAAADDTWKELLDIVGGEDGMPAAGIYTHEDLPRPLRQRHSVVTMRPGGPLQQLIDHSSVTLEGIQKTIAGSSEVRREALEMRVIDSLEKAQVAVVTGAAGHGKSAVAKQVLEQIEEDYFCLAFRAEEFARNHLDQALAEAQNSLTKERFSGLLSAQGHKVVLVESVERLLESSERKAFLDLLRLAEEDQSLRLLLTCRDYSVETVRRSLLEQTALPYDTVEVQPFSDDDLDQVAREVPRLSGAIETANLRELLRSPYLLNVAAQIDWSEGEAFPESERAFRDRCWGEVVRSDVEAAGGMPRKRGRTFSNLALRRAKKLRPFVSCADLDPEALGKLEQDDLVVFSRESRSLAAPAHDVLEDWAVIRWLNSRFALHERDPDALASDIGGYPALRRGYRKWLGEMLANEPEKTDVFALSAFTEGSLPSHFRDDTIVCILLSDAAENFLLRNRERLLEDEARLLARVIHLLRVACKTTWLGIEMNADSASMPLTPTGAAWAPVLRIVSDELEALLPEHFGVVLGLVEDWSRQVAVWNSEPAGYEATGEIITELLEGLGGYQSKDQRQRALKVFGKIPKAAPETFEDLVQRARAGDRDDTVASDFAELMLTEVSGTFACRDFPEEMTSLAMSYFCLTDKDVEAARQGPFPPGSSTGVEVNFGIKENVNHKFSIPPSAIKGPFWPLLRWHPRVGVRFITALMNHACEWYGEQKWPFDSLEPAWQTQFEIPGEEEVVTQWANGRLYGGYRSIVVVPYVLQSALMALEKWLLKIAELDDVNLESWLIKLLRDSNNVAVTAVVASVCIAHPEKCGRAGLALLTCKDIVRLDRRRMARDQVGSSASVAAPRAKDRVFAEERKTSNALDHRNVDLEFLAVKLQRGEMREAVWEIIDQHRERLPPLEEQSEEDRTWRLALHRMDGRGLEIGEEIPATAVEGDSGSSEENGEEEDGEEEEEMRYFKIGLGKLEADLEEMVDRSEENFAQQTATLSILNWGRSAWEGTLDSNAKPWKEMLSEAREQDAESKQGSGSVEALFDPGKGGPGFVAAVCVRDHWEEMESENRAWCLRKLIEEIERGADNEDAAMFAGGGGGMFPDRYAARALPRVLKGQDADEMDDGVVAAVATALTHSVSDVREHAAEGVGHHLQGAGSTFAMRCAGALAEQVRLTKEARNQQGKKPRGPGRGRKITRSVVPEVRQSVASGNVDVEGELSSLDTREWSRRPRIQLILRILNYHEETTLAAELFTRVARAFAEDWKGERDQQGVYRNDYEFEFWCARRVARFALKLGRDEAVAIYEPLLDVVEEHPKDVETFVEGLIMEEDTQERETPFWEIWQVFADRLWETEWIDKLDARYMTASNGRKLLRTLLFGIQWKEDLRYWPRMRGQESRVETFVQEIPASSAALKWYCRFLYHLGEQALPGGFEVVVERLEAGNPSEALAESNTIYYLESLLRRYVYGEPLQLKTDPQVRRAVLDILDHLVEAGSSAAYKMRDDFVTPVSPSVTA